MLMEIYNPKWLFIIIIYFGKRDGPSYCRMSVPNLMNTGQKLRLQCLDENITLEKCLKTVSLDEDWFSFHLHVSESNYLKSSFRLWAFCNNDKRSQIICYLV